MLFRSQSPARPTQIDQAARTTRNSSHSGSITRNLHLLSCVGLVGLVGAWGSGEARAQAQVRDYTRPLLVLNPPGHHAPVRSLLFTPDGDQLLSGGMDKIAQVWDVRAARPERVRTLRPPQWRGLAGSIRAMALSPIAMAQNQRWLAVGGMGVENQGGTIVLFRYPGLASFQTGDLAGYLYSGTRGAAEPQGHTDGITALAFSPDGQTLASAGLDAKVVLWDMATRRPRAVLAGQTRAVNALAFLPGGNRVATGGEDGILRVWDVNQPAAPILSSPARGDAEDPLSFAIRALAITPDGRFVLVGRSNGEILRHDTANPANLIVLSRDADDEVRSLSVSPDGSKLLSTRDRGIPRPNDVPRPVSTIELRDLPEGGNRRVLLETPNLSYATAFRPDGKAVAVSGGDTHSVFLIRLDNPGGNPAIVDLKGNGRAIWDVGFTADSQGLGYSWTAPERADAPATYWGFGLVNRNPTTYERASLRRALSTWEGWTVTTPVDPFTVDVTNPQGRGFRIKLDANRDGRWWCYSLVPPGPGHLQPVVAIGCQAGVAIHELQTGGRTRMLAGHAGPVLALAPSPDGRWLATGSADQTIRLWSLKGCEARPMMGAAFDKAADGTTATVSRVDRFSFAEAMGLKVGDIGRKFALGDNFVPRDEFLTKMDAAEPGTPVQLEVSRRIKLPMGWTVNDVVRLGSTRRETPALTLFLGEDREWVLWMPQGFYDTSIAGDRSLLGWHQNVASVFGPWPAPTIDRPPPTDFFAIDRFEAELRRPALINQVLALGDVPAALGAVITAEPSALVQRDQPPTIEIEASSPRQSDGSIVAVAPPAAAAAAAPRPVSLLLAAAQFGRPIVRYLIQVDSKIVQTIAVQPSERVTSTPPLDLPPGRHTVVVKAINDQGKERIARQEYVSPVAAARPEPAAKPRKLHLIALGAETFAGSGLPAIPHAGRDVQALAPFLAEHWYDGPAQGVFESSRVETNLLAGAQATSEKFLDKLDALQDKLDRKELSDGDWVVLVIESHALNFDKSMFLVGSDASSSAPPKPAISARDLATRLGNLAHYGCKVLVLIDAVHPGTTTDLKDWVRHLQVDQDVVAFVASSHGPSQTHLANGAFAWGVLQCLDVAGQSRQRAEPDAPFSLFDFQDGVKQTVLEVTRRRQNAACYVPDSISLKIPLLDPRGR